jgi:hypothetical protein
VRDRVHKIGLGNGDVIRFDRLARPAKQRWWSGWAEVRLRSASLPRIEIDTGPNRAALRTITPRRPGVMSLWGTNLPRCNRPKPVRHRR